MNKPPPPPPDKRMPVEIAASEYSNIGDITMKCLYATRYVNILLGLTSAGPSTEQPVNIPLHDSELVYVVGQLRPAAFRNLATSLQIPEADVNLIPTNDSRHAQEMRIDALCSWRDSQKDFLKARTNLAEKVKEARTQQYAQSFSTVEFDRASNDILKGRK